MRGTPLAVLLALGGACSNDPAIDSAVAQVDAAPVAPAVVAQAGDTRELAPARPNHTHSWEEFVHMQAPADAEYLRQLDERYFGALSYRSAEELRFLLQSGFPTPQEWLEAQDMTDQQLRDAADSGDRKAAGMYADRLAERLALLRARQSTRPDVGDSRERTALVALAVNYASAAGMGTKGAFGVYMEGMVKSRIFETPEPLTAAMLEARRRGDPRTSRLISEMAARHPTQNVERLYSLLEGF